MFGLFLCCQLLYHSSDPAKFVTTSPYMKWQNKKSLVIISEFNAVVAPVMTKNGDLNYFYFSFKKSLILHSEDYIWYQMESCLSVFVPHTKRLAELIQNKGVGLFMNSLRKLISLF